MQKNKEKIKKRRFPLEIAIIILLIMLILVLSYKIYQVKNFQKDLREPTETEKQEIKNIVSENLNITDAQIIFGDVFTKNGRILIPIQIKEGRFRKGYLINLENKSLIMKYHEH